MAVESAPPPIAESPTSETHDTPAVSAVLTTIRGMFDSGRPLIYIQSAEEDRVVGVLQRIAGGLRGGVEFFQWSTTEGLQKNGTPTPDQPGSARSMLDVIIARQQPGIFLLKDFHEFIREAADIRRRLRDLYYECLNTGKFAVILSPAKVIPEEISHEVAFSELPRPDLKELEELITAEVQEAPGIAVPPADTLHALARAVQGLTFQESRHAIQRGITEHGKLDMSIIRTLEEEKQQLVRKAGLIEFVPNTTGINQIGGLEVLKHWLTQRRDLFLARDSISSEIIPKGLLLMGISGCGKSLSARAVASAFGLPLYRIDMVQVFSAGLSNAERFFSSACRTLEQVAPAVAWFDEIENGLSHQHQDDTGALDRIFGFFLTWMQEKLPGLFVVATANRIDLLPAEMIRKGRFDQVFFVDLPDKDDRRDIFNIHLKRRGLDPAGMDIDGISERTEGWTGAEIEQAVIASIIAARLAKEPVGNKYLYPAIRGIVPLSRTMKEQVNHIRSWAFDRAIRASARKFEA